MSAKNYLNILSMTEKDMAKVIFSKGHEEGGINCVYDPGLDSEVFQVFVHTRLPFATQRRWEFNNFSEARRFAAAYFSKEWEFLSWNFRTERPCEKEGRECGTGTCETCQTLAKDMEAKGEMKASSGCGTATGQGSCGYA